MAKGNMVTVQENNRQVFCTIPRSLADALGIKKGDKMQWVLDRGDLVLRMVK